MIDIKEKKLSGYTFIDLFAGLGGFRLALESLGAACVFASEWDPPVRQVYRENFGDLPHGDITRIAGYEVPDHDILCAGFPCQAFSISGKQRGFRDARGTLFFDVARIVKEKRPKAAFLENVKNFASHDGGRTLEAAKGAMEGLGYDFYWKVLNAADYGIPQNRQRIYMVCFRKDLGIRGFSYPEPFPLTRHLEDFLLEEEEIDGRLYVRRADIHYGGREDVRYGSRPIRLGTVNRGGQGERIYSAKGAAVTLSASGGGAFAKTGGYLIHGKPRRLHPRECARIMGYPDSYKISENESQAYRQFGNSVVVDVLQLIALEIGRALEGRDAEKG